MVLLFKNTFTSFTGDLVCQGPMLSFWQYNSLKKKKVSIFKNFAKDCLNLFSLHFICIWHGWGCLELVGHWTEMAVRPLYHYQLDVVHGCWICYVSLDTKVAQTWCKIYIYYCIVSGCRLSKSDLAGSFAYFSLTRLKATCWWRPWIPLKVQTVKDSLQGSCWVDPGEFRISCKPKAWVSGWLLACPSFVPRYMDPSIGNLYKMGFQYIEMTKQNQDFTLLVLVESINWFSQKCQIHIIFLEHIWFDHDASSFVYLVLFGLISSGEFCIVNWKNTWNIKIESYVLFIGNFYDLSLGGSISSEPEWTALWRQEVI